MAAVVLFLAIVIGGCSTPTYPPPRSLDAGYARPVSDPPAPVTPSTVEPRTVDDGGLDETDFGLDDLGTEEAQVDDPLEDVNRAIFAFNDVADRFVLGPIARTYGFIVPQPAKDAVQRAYQNLRAPARFANDLLQGQVSDAGTTGGRFLINSTLGLAGLFDPADHFGLEHHVSDFGQTLNAYGIGPGPYLVLPLFGASTVRDGTGLVVDSLLDPLRYLLPLEYTLAIGAGEAVVTREAFDEAIEELRATSIDPYATLRSIYSQNRARQLDPEIRGRSTTNAR